MSVTFSHSNPACSSPQWSWSCWFKLCVLHLGGVFAVLEGVSRGKRRKEEKPACRDTCLRPDGKHPLTHKSCPPCPHLLFPFFPLVALLTSTSTVQELMLHLVYSCSDCNSQSSQLLICKCWYSSLHSPSINMHNNIYLMSKIKVEMSSSGCYLWSYYTL